MKKIHYIILFLLVLVSTSCERTIDFEGPKEETANDVVINALAVADGELIVYLNRAYLVNKTPTQYFDYDHAVLAKDDIAADYALPYYSQRTAITNAQVTAIVNGQEQYDLLFDADDLSFKTDYVPKVGDNIVVTATQGKDKVRVETTVPAKPKIEIVNHEILVENPYSEINGLLNPASRIMRLTCRISDAGGKQYYRLRVRSEVSETATSFNKEQYYWYVMQDVYFSDDELFTDHRLTSNFGGWPAYFSNVFDNSLMQRGEYTFSLDALEATPSLPYRDTDLETKKVLEAIPSRVVVELQAISSDLYRYLKSVQLYRVSEDDVYSEPVQIYSNAEGGWGIFGALSYDRHFVEYGE